jgi:uncharacterized protein YbdZ (MbtH family)
MSACGDGEVIWVFPRRQTEGAPIDDETFATITNPDGRRAFWPTGSETPVDWSKTDETCPRRSCLAMPDERDLLAPLDDYFGREVKVLGEVEGDPIRIESIDPPRTGGASASASASVSASLTGGATPTTSSPGGIGATMQPLTAGQANLAAWVQQFAETLGAEMEMGGLRGGTIGDVNGAVQAVYKTGRIVDFVMYAKSAVISSGGVVTSESLASQTVQARFPAGGPPRVVISQGPGGITIVAQP